MDKYIPGTNMLYTAQENTFSVFKPFIEITGGLSLRQVCSITSLSTTTIQNWVKRGYVPRPENKKYYERHLSRILLISSLRDSMNIEEIGELMTLVNGDTENLNDDIISETTLYDNFCKIVNKIDEEKLSDENINSILEEILINDDSGHKQQISYALKVLVYGYYAGHYIKNVKDNMQALRDNN